MTLTRKQFARRRYARQYMRRYCEKHNRHFSRWWRVRWAHLEAYGTTRNKKFPTTQAAARYEWLFAAWTAPR